MRGKRAINPYSLIVIAIIAILASMLLPALNKAREMSRQTNCLNNFKQLGLAYYMYLDDNKEHFPESFNNGLWWANRILPYIKAKNTTNKLFECPSWINNEPSFTCKGYASNDNICSYAGWYTPRKTLLQLRRPTALLLLVDSKTSNACPWGYSILATVTGRHRLGSNILFVDGHTAWLKEELVLNNVNDLWGSTFANQ